MNRRSWFGGKPYLLKGTVFTEVGFWGKLVVAVVVVAVAVVANVVVTFKAFN